MRIYMKSFDDSLCYSMYLLFKEMLNVATSTFYPIHRLTYSIDFYLEWLRTPVTSLIESDVCILHILWMRLFEALITNLTSTSELHLVEIKSCYLSTFKELEEVNGGCYQAFIQKCGWHEDKRSHWRWSAKCKSAGIAKNRTHGPLVRSENGNSTAQPPYIAASHANQAFIKSTAGILTGKKSYLCTKFDLHICRSAFQALSRGM